MKTYQTLIQKRQDFYWKTSKENESANLHILLSCRKSKRRIRTSEIRKK